MANLVVVLVFGKNEIEDAHQINRFEPVIPVATLFLLPNRKTRVINAAVLKVFLLGALHLDDEAFAVLPRAKQIEDRPPVEFGTPHVFLVRENQILNPMFRRQQLVEKINQQVFVWLAAEQPLETVVGKRVYVFFSNCHNRHLVA